MLPLIRSPKAYLAVCLLLALLYRLDYLFASNFVIDSDEAIVGLMGKHISEGKALPIFYYGQPYMGSFEAFFAALIFKLLGVSSFALRMVPLILSLVFVLLLYRLGMAIANKYVARAMALLGALPPAALLEWGSRARGGFIETLVIGVLVLLACLSFLRHASFSLRHVGLIALLLGFGWWTNNQIIYFAPVCAFVVLTRIVHGSKHKFRDLAQGAAIGVGAFLIGGLPFWIYNLNHNFESFGLFKSGDANEIAEHFSGLFSISLPILLGASRFWQTSEIFPSATILAFVIYGLLLLLVAAGRYRQLGALFRLRLDYEAPIELCWIVLLTIIVVFSLSSFGFLVQAPRYLLPIYIPLFILCGYALYLIRRKNVALARAGLLLLVGLNLSSFYYGGRAIPGEPFVYKGERVSRDQSELTAWLLKNRYAFVLTNYWIGYRLAFETGEAVRFLVLSDPGEVRIDSYQQEGKAYKGDIPLVLVPAQAIVFEAVLKQFGLVYERVELSGYVILYNVIPSQFNLQKISPEGMSVAVSHNSAAASNILDNNTSTRWGSAQPQSPHMRVEISFSAPHKLRALSYDLSTWLTDYPRDLSLRLISPSGEERALVSSGEIKALREYFSSDSTLKFYFEPFEVSKIVLEQLGGDPVFDWSIAELSFFE